MSVIQHAGYQAGRDISLSMDPGHDEFANPVNLPDRQQR